MKKYSIGLDFGTESVRALLVSVIDGEVLATSIYEYPDGVMDERLSGSQTQLPPNWALQNPMDWLAGIEETVGKVLSESKVSGEDVIGIGIDFTSCTILPTLRDGTPLCTLEELKQTPHAWAKLWKHHGAQPQADRITALAGARKETWLPRYGGIISSEWLLPKAFEILEDSPGIYERAAYIIEGADWVAWQLTGRMVRNTCCAGYKGTWHKQDGYPNQAFLRALDKRLVNLFTEKVSGPILPPGQKVGGLIPEWAERLGLSAGTSVAAAIIDAHSAAIGGGVSEPGTMFLIMGTSTCHMLMSEKEVLVEGISGVVEDGIVPGLFGYEAGQVSVGDIFAWYIENGIPGAYAQEAEMEGISLHERLTQKGLALKPGQSGLLALDWWNGCRTPLVDADLSGMLLGYNLQTKPEEIYRALIEATAFGNRLIVELFQDGGVQVEKLRAGGGLTKNELVLKTYADIMGLPIEIAFSSQASALGAAVLGAVAGDAHADIHSAVEKMVAPPSRVIQPDLEKHAIYDEIYAEYKRMFAEFGQDAQSPMKNLMRIRNRALSEI